MALVRRTAFGALGCLMVAVSVTMGEPVFLNNKSEPTGTVEQGTWTFTTSFKHGDSSIVQIEGEYAVYIWRFDGVERGEALNSSSLTLSAEDLTLGEHTITVDFEACGYPDTDPGPHWNGTEWTIDVVPPGDGHPHADRFSLPSHQDLLLASGVPHAGSFGIAVDWAWNSSDDHPEHLKGLVNECITFDGILPDVFTSPVTQGMGEDGYLCPDELHGQDEYWYPPGQFRTPLADVDDGGEYVVNQEIVFGCRYCYPNAANASDVEWVTFAVRNITRTVYSFPASDGSGDFWWNMRTAVSVEGHHSDDPIQR